MSNDKKRKINPKYHPVGAFMEKKEKDEEGRAQYYIKIDSDTVVTINGKKVTALNIQRPTDKFQNMLAKGVITEEQYEEKMSQYDGSLKDQKGDLSYIKFELTANLEDKK